MSEHIESVNRLVVLYRKHAERAEGAERERSNELAKRFEAVSAELVRLYGLTSALPSDLGNIFELPPDLRKELSVAKADELEDHLVTVINACGSTASLDQILVGLFRKFGISQKRRFIQNKLYRMTMVWSVPGKKGVYTTDKPKDSIFAGTTIDEVAGAEPGPNEEEKDNSEIPF